MPENQLSPGPGDETPTEISIDQPSPSPDGAVNAGESPVPSEVRHFD